MPSTSPTMHSRRTASVSPIQEKTAAKHEQMHLSKQSSPGHSSVSLSRTLTSANVPHNNNKSAIVGRRGERVQAGLTALVNTVYPHLPRSVQPSHVLLSRSRRVSRHITEYGIRPSRATTKSSRDMETAQHRLYSFDSFRKG